MVRWCARAVVVTATLVVAGGLAVSPVFAQDTALAVTGVSFGTLSQLPSGEDTHGAGDTIEVVVEFNEPVEIDGSPQLQLGIGTATRTAEYDHVWEDGTGIGFHYTVQAADRDDDGISVAADALKLNGATIQDDAGNNAVLDLGEHAIDNDAGHKVDGSLDRAPVVEWVYVSEPSSGDTFGLDDRIDIHVGFNEALNVTGSPQLTLTIGSAERAAVFDSVFDDRMGVGFYYTVKADDRDPDGISIAADALSLNGATIRDSGGNDAVLDLGDLPSSDGVVRRVDGSLDRAPMVERAGIVTDPQSGDTYGVGEEITIDVNFTEPVTVTGTPQLELTIGTATRTVPMNNRWADERDAGLGFTYVVRAEDRDGNGISIAADALKLNGATIRDSGRNDAVRDLGEHAIDNHPDHKVDGSIDRPPVVEWVWVSKPFSGDTFGLGDRIRIHVNFTKVLNVVGEPQLTLTLSDSETRIVEYEGLDDERRKLLFFYDVQSEDRSPGGLGISADALILNGATIRDSGGNDADLDLGEQAISDDGGHKVDGSIDNPPAVRWAGLESRPASGDTYALGETIVFDVSFNEPVTVTGTPELTLMIGTEMRTAESTGLWDDGRGFGLEYEVQSADLDRDGISIAADALRLPGGAAIRDSAGNDANLDLSEHAISNDGEHKVDGIIDNPPAVGGLCCFSEPQSGDTFSLGERIGINVHFTEAVMVTGTPQVTLTLSDTETRPMDYDHTCCDDRVLIFYYEVQSADRSAGGLSVGTHALILNSGTIRDVNGNDAAVLDLGEHEYTAPDPNRKVDGGIDNPPVVQWADVDSRPVDNDTYALGEMIEIHVGFNEPVTVSGKPQLELSIGTDTRTVDMDSVCCDERMDHLRFRYTVQAADRDNDGISFAANALRLNGATIQDRGGNDADLDLGEHAIINDENHRIDGSIDRPPGVQWVHVSEPVSGDTFTRGDRIEIHVGFNESISVNGTPQLELSIGADTRTVDLDDVCCGDRMDHIKGEYTVQAEDRDSDGISIAANALSLNGATIQDSGGNDAEPDLGEEAISNDPNRKVDGSIVTAPRIRDIYFVDYGLPAADTYQLGDPIEVHVQFDKAVTMTGAPQLALTVGTQMRQMNCYRVWNKRVLFCNYRVQATDLDEDGVSVAANSLVLNGGTIKSSSDGTIDADLHHKAVAETPARKVEGSQVSIPVVSEISFSSSSPASDDTYELGELIWVRVVFDREVNVVSAPQLALVVGTETRQMTLPSTYLGRRQRLDFSYTVQETDRDADGISIPANPLQGGTVTHSFDSTVDADLTHAAVADDPTKKVDGSQVSAPKMAQSPRIWREPASSNTYARGETVQILVFFDKPVAITGTPQLALTIGTRTRPSYYSESITDSPDILVFEYVVQAEDRDVDGISVAANALDAGGGTITLSGHDDIKADLTHKAVPNNRDYKVDGSSASAPKVAAVRFRSFPTSDGTYEHGEMVEVEVIFDKAVAVTGAPRLALTIGTQTRQAMYDRTQYGRLLYFHYTVQAEDRDDDGISIAANALDAGDGAITLPGPDPVDADLTLQALADDPLHKVGAGPGPQLGCKPPMRAARVQSLQAAATQGDGEGQAPAFELTLELEENRDGSGQAVEVGCVALADGDRQFSYEITDGNDGSRFTVGTSDGMISYVGSGENAERTSEYALTVTATPQDAGTAPQLPVRIAIANVNDPGVVTLSTTQPVIGDSVTAELEDEDRGVQDVSWQWRRQGSNGAWTEIQGATAAEYTPVAADAGHSLQVRTSYVDEHGAQQAASPLTAAVDLDATRREQILKLGLASLGRSVASAAVDAIGQRFGSAAAAGAPDAMALDVTLNRQPLHFPDPRDTAASGRLASSVARALGCG